MMKIFKRLMIIFIMAGLMLPLPLTAQAAGNIDLTKDTRLNISYHDGDKALSNAKFSIYLVATIDRYGELTVTDDFKDYNVDIRGKNDETWKELATTLEGYVLRDKITPADSGTTDTRGELSFPTNDKRLDMGLYLVIGERHKQGHYRYDPQPFMVLLPTQDLEKNVWDYTVTADVKYDRTKTTTPPPPTGDTVTRKVLKVWNDADYESERPKSITVQLLRDGEVYEEVTLNAENNWRYTWDSLDDSFTWRIVEKTPSGYTVSITREGITFVVTNTLSKNPPDNPPDNPPTPDNPDNHNNPSAPNLPDKPIVSENPKLPQTGVLWWPVPVLLCAGVVLIAVGLASQRGK